MRRLAEVIPRRCEYCGTAFSQLAWRSRQGEPGRWCSTECADLDRVKDFHLKAAVDGYREGQSLRSLAHAHKVSHETIRRWLQKVGEPIRSRGRPRSA